MLKRTSPWRAALATPIDKYRITFALPWEDMLLLGTTDEAYEGDPADVRCTEQDITQILDEAAFSVRDQQLSRDLITYSFAGLRVLPGGPGDTSKAKRETVVTEGRGGMLSVAGGKWTTFRHIGRTVMTKLAELPGQPLAEDMEPITRLPKQMPLPGIANPQRGRPPAAGRRRHAGPAHGRGHRTSPRHPLRLAVLRHRPAGERATRRSAERIHPDAPEIWAQVVYARDHEWAETADDVLRRRTTLTIRGLDTEEVRTGSRSCSPAAAAERTSTPVAGERKGRDTRQGLSPGCLSPSFARATDGGSPAGRAGRLGEWSPERRRGSSRTAPARPDSLDALEDGVLRDIRRRGPFRTTDASNTLRDRQDPGRGPARHRRSGTRQGVRAWTSTHLWRARSATPRWYG